MTDVANDPVQDFIARTVAEHPVVLFMKGTPDAPRCGFSALTVQILDHVGAQAVVLAHLDDGIPAGRDQPRLIYRNGADHDRAFLQYSGPYGINIAAGAQVHGHAREWFAAADPEPCRPTPPR